MVDSHEPRQTLGRDSEAFMTFHTQGDIIGLTTKECSLFGRMYQQTTTIGIAVAVVKPHKTNTVLDLMRPNTFQGKKPKTRTVAAHTIAELRLFCCAPTSVSLHTITAYNAVASREVIKVKSFLTRFSTEVTDDVIVIVVAKLLAIAAYLV